MVCLLETQGAKGQKVEAKYQLGVLLTLSPPVHCIEPLRSENRVVKSSTCCELGPPIPDPPKPKTGALWPPPSVTAEGVGWLPWLLALLVLSFRELSFVRAVLMLLLSLLCARPPTGGCVKG